MKSNLSVFSYVDHVFTNLFERQKGPKWLGMEGEGTGLPAEVGEGKRGQITQSLLNQDGEMASYSKCNGKPWKGTKQRNDSLFLQNEVFMLF